MALLPLIVSVGVPLVSTATETSWSLNSRFRFGLRSLALNEVSTLQHQSEFLAESETSSNWSFQAGARLRSDGAYSLNRSRYQDLELRDPPELELREANVEYRSDYLIARLGSQVVPWGEAFGSFYADILNPKDLREAGFGDLSDLRIPVEMLNLKVIQKDWSVQGIYIPFYRPNRLPRPGSDFFPNYLKNQLQGFSIDFDQGASPEDANGDLGARLQGQIGGVDISVFGLNLIDRQPLSTFAFSSPSSINVRTRSLRLQSFGLTMNWAADWFVVRSEVVKYVDRGFNVLEQFGFVRADQSVYVLGLDWPVQSGLLKNWQASFQYSFDQISVGRALGRKQEESVLGLQLSKEQEYGANVRLLVAYSISDLSTLAQAMVLYPINRSSSWGFDIWHFDGASDSQFGSLREGSRVMFVLKGVFSG